jgi:MFS family permease
MGAAGGSAGVLLGGVLTDLLTWRWVLFVNVPIGLAVAALTMRFITRDQVTAPKRNFDLSGALSATVGLSVLVLGIVRTDVTGWGSTQALALIGAGALMLALFVAIEGRFARAPLMPLRIYASRTLSAANGVVLLIGAATFGMWFFVSLYLQQVLGYSPIRAGLAFLPMTISIAVGSTLASRGIRQFGTKRMLVAGMLAQTVGLLLFAKLPADGHYASNVLLPSLLVAIGMGLSIVPATIAAVSGVAPREAGLASGLVNTSRLVGGALGLAILAALATAQSHAHHAVGVAATHAALVSGFHLAFIVAAGVSLAGGLVALVGLPRRPSRPRERALQQQASVEAT